MRTGGKFVKATSGYDLTQLIIGSEGTLALVTRAMSGSSPGPPSQATLLAPFATLERSPPPCRRSWPAASARHPRVHRHDGDGRRSPRTPASTSASPRRSGRAPSPTWSSSSRSTHADRLEEDVEALATCSTELGALDVYVLPDHAGAAADRRPGAGVLGGQGGRGRRHHRRGRAPGGHPRATWPRWRAGGGARRTGGRLRPRGRRQRAPRRCSSPTARRGTP